MKLIVGQNIYNEMTKISDGGKALILRSGGEAKALVHAGLLLDGLPFVVDPLIPPGHAYEEDEHGTRKRIMGEV